MSDSRHPDPSGPRRGLGRGLGALLTSTELTNAASPQVREQAAAGGILMVDLHQVSPNPRQPRTEFEETALLELAASIREHGILQPLIVTRNPQVAQGYWLIAGERRWRAAQLAGQTTVPVIVREATPQQLLEWALVENVQRADLNPLEEGAAYQELMVQFGLTQAQVADRVGRSRSAVANIVRLLQLPQAAQTALANDRISAGHARALLALPSDEAMVAALNQILAKNLNVRQTEALVRDLLSAVESQEADLESADEQTLAQLREMENRFRATLSTKVSLKRRADGSGQLVIHFYSDDDLNALYQVISGPDVPL